jgi:putative DNA primase/helicase
MGKSKLVDLASMIASGHEAPVLAQGKTEEEMEKRLGAALIAGDTLVSFDNCEQPLGGELLCQVLTQSTVSIRILGKSVNKVVPANAAFFATGNNLVVIGDMTRRTLLCSLDARVERPETRTFQTEDPVKVVRRDRAKYVVAALTILRAYQVAGRPEQGTVPLGSFEDWSRSVRDALIWLGEPDPCKTMERARADDPRLQELAAVLTQWNASIGSTAITVKELIDRATTRYNGGPGSFDLNPPGFLYPDLREALLVVAGDGGAINSRRLGTWLGRNKFRLVDGLKLGPATVQDGYKRWKVTKET